MVVLVAPEVSLPEAYGYRGSVEGGSAAGLRWQPDGRECSCGVVTTQGLHVRCLGLVKAATLSWQQCAQ